MTNEAEALDPAGITAVVRAMNTSDMTLRDSRQAQQQADAVRYIRAYLAALAAPVTPQAVETTFQQQVDPWLIACFGLEIARDKTERNHRFLEEALELVQSGGCTASEAHQLVDYVYGRPVGDMLQEVGGVMNTLAALCLAYGLDMHKAGDIELARVWTKVEKIRAKQAAKPKHSPLPEAPPQPAQQADLVDLIADLNEGVRRCSEDEDGRDLYDIDDASTRMANAAEAIAALSAAPTPEGWRPMDSVPKNTKVLLGYWNGNNKWRTVTACYWTQLPWADDQEPEDDAEYAPAGWYEESETHDVILMVGHEPAGWMPLPAAPKREA